VILRDCSSQSCFRCLGSGACWLSEEDRDGEEEADGERWMLYSATLPLTLSPGCPYEVSALRMRCQRRNWLGNAMGLNAAQVGPASQVGCSSLVVRR